MCFMVAAFTMEDRFIGLEEIVVLVTGKVGFLRFLTVFDALVAMDMVLIVRFRPQVDIVEYPSHPSSHLLILCM